MAEKEVKRDHASLVAEIARNECKKMYERRPTGLEEDESEALSSGLPGTHAPTREPFNKSLHV